MRASIVFHPVELVLDSTQQETLSAILRASLIPGWGPIKRVGRGGYQTLAARLNPQLRARLRMAGQREWFTWIGRWIG